MLCTSLFLKRVMRGFQRTPAHTGKEGLFRLVRLAHSRYSEEVPTRLKSYHRFTLDFINSNQYHDDTDAWSKNEHQKNYRIVAELLTNHEKMVHRYFDCDLLNEQAINNLLNEFYASDLPELMTPDGSVTDTINAVCDNTITLYDDHTIDLIVRLANEVSLFTEVLDVNETIRRYKRRELRTVTSSNNSRLTLVFDRLSFHNIIPYNWQSLIERERYILSSTGNKYLNKHDLASTLHRIKDMPLSPQNKKVLSVVDGYVRLIKDRENKQE